MTNDQDQDLATEAVIRERLREVQRRNQARAPEILAAITAGTATAEQLDATVELHDGRVKTWRYCSPDDIEQLRRALAF